MKIVISEKWEKIKEHVVYYKEAYIAGASAAVLSAGITVLIMRGNIARGEMSKGSARGELTNTASLIFKNNQKIVNVTTVFDREGRGHPGWPVRNLETKQISPSIRAAAEIFDIPANVLYGHLKGKFDDVDGLHFERINLIPLGED